MFCVRDILLHFVTLSFSPFLANFATRFMRELEFSCIVSAPKIRENRKRFFDPVCPEP